MKHFQPNGKCGNCQFFRHSKKDKNKVVIEMAGCTKGNDPKTCQDFASSSKRHKTKQRHLKSWMLEKRGNG